MYLDTLVKWQILYADVWSIRIFATHTCFWLWTYQNNFETLKPKPNETTELVSAETYERNHFEKKTKPKHTNETILEKKRNRNIRTKPFWKKTETETYERNHFGKKPKPKHTNETILRKNRNRNIQNGFGFGGFAKHWFRVPKPWFRPALVRILYRVQISYRVQLVNGILHWISKVNCK